ncbi:uncharacterized protein LOC131200143 isoform X1 [Ahaetulla prasina]|uniref:uncharacterized protein LOC131200143 isoform X1 n=1 Tax=Ahaetulla prasina TaxID=499056 RepID=UPI00264725DE|nr:uncharacterized protein LOC131200143 isoform X1 [Ahaetulla prasina]
MTEGWPTDGSKSTLPYPDFSDSPGLAQIHDALQSRTPPLPLLPPPLISLCPPATIPPAPPSLPLLPAPTLHSRVQSQLRLAAACKALREVLLRPSINRMDRQRLKTTKPTIKSVKTWTEESKLKLQACFDCTDWNIFEDTSAGTVTSYVSFCEDLYIPTKTLRIYSNNKLWFTPKLKQLRHSKEEAYRKGDKMLYNQARNVLTREIRAAKRSYSEKLKNQFSANEPANMWKTLKNITGYGKPPSQAEGNQQLADDLNVFYCRFERKLQPPISITPISPTTAKPPTTDLIPLDSQPLVITEKEVQDLFHRQKPGKAPGPDKITPSCLKVCADQLAPIFTHIFNKSLEMCYVPSCFEHSTIIPVPKKPTIKELNDYRPVALTSVVMKASAFLLENHHGSAVRPLAICIPSK